MNTKLIERIQNIVLSNVLTEWDDDLSYPQVLKAIADEEWDKAYPWEPLEDVSGQDLANMVCDIVHHVKRAIEEEQK